MDATTVLAPVIGMIVVAVLYATVSQRARRTGKGFVVEYGIGFKILAIAAMLLALAFVVAVFFARADQRWGVVVMALFCLVVGVPLFMMAFLTRFDVEDEVMIVHSPWTRVARQIPLSDIEAIRPQPVNQRYEVRTKGHGKIYLYEQLSGLSELVDLINARFNKQIAVVVDVIIHDPQGDENDWVQRIDQTVRDPDLAERLVEFVPLAFSRVILSRLGVNLAETFIRPLDEDGKFSEDCPLEAEPIWLPCQRFAQQAQSRLSHDEFLSIARRSAEFDAVNNALNAGSDPKNLVGSPPILMRIAPLPRDE